jgi:acyl-CoA synthetase (AMP-forming)/AMP-acid ligase II
MSTPARLTWADIRARAVAFARECVDGPFRSQRVALLFTRYAALTVPLA